MHSPNPADEDQLQSCRVCAGFASVPPVTDLAVRTTGVLESSGKTHSKQSKLCSIPNNLGREQTVSARRVTDYPQFVRWHCSLATLQSNGAKEVTARDKNRECRATILFSFSFSLTPLTPTLMKESFSQSLAEPCRVSSEPMQSSENFHPKNYSA